MADNRQKRGWASKGRAEQSCRIEHIIICMRSLDMHVVMLPRPQREAAAGARAAARLVVVVVVVVVVVIGGRW